MKWTLLVIEDEDAVQFSVKRFFAAKGYRVSVAGTLAEGRRLFDSERPDVVLLDYCMPDGDGIELLRLFRGADPTVPVVFLTGHATIDVAVRAMKEGAEQFFTKPVELGTLLVVVERLVENRRNRQLSLADRSRQSRLASDPFLGDSTPIRELAERARRVAAASSNVLIQGETGSGKGLIARWLHENGPRSGEAFVDLNCAGLSREFLETELFGHEKGAFTGAASAKPGLFEIAHRGTLFLDEIGDVNPDLQPKLLKVLEEQRFRRLGAVKDRQVDVRLIAATHHDLEELVRHGRFRSDLYYRVGAIPLRLPALRERGGDVVVLARLLLERIGTEIGRVGLQLSPGAERALMERDWPGNIRELRNVLERAALLGDASKIPAEALAGTSGSAVSGRPAGRPLTLKEAERRHIEAVLRQNEGDVVAAAGILGLSRSALYQKLRNHGLHASRPRPTRLRD